MLTYEEAINKLASYEWLRKAWTQYNKGREIAEIYLLVKETVPRSSHNSLIRFLTYGGAHNLEKAAHFSFRYGAQLIKLKEQIIEKVKEIDQEINQI